MNTLFNPLKINIFFLGPLGEIEYRSPFKKEYIYLLFISCLFEEKYMSDRNHPEVRNLSCLVWKRNGIERHTKTHGFTLLRALSVLQKKGNESTTSSV